MNFTTIFVTQHFTFVIAAHLIWMLIVNVLNFLYLIVENLIVGSQESGKYVFSLSTQGGDRMSRGESETGGSGFHFSQIIDFVY